MNNITINKNQTVNNGQFTFDSYTPITCYIVFYFIVRLDKPYPISGTKTFHKILRGTSAKKVKKHCFRVNTTLFLLAVVLFIVKLDLSKTE